MMKVRMVRDILPSVLERLEGGQVRAPIRNAEPRQPMGGHKWHLIHERDGGRCRECGGVAPKGTGEIDHVIPRSSFEVADLPVADRSDNLRLLCVPCNQSKSNYYHDGYSCPPGVTAACWDCLAGGPDPEQEPEEYSDYWRDRWRPELTVPAYCGRCGYTWVPDAGWLL